MSKVQRIFSEPVLPDSALETPSESFTELLRARRKAEVAAFLNALREPSLKDAVIEDSEALAAILDLAIGDYGVQQKELAGHLQVSPAAIGRWRANENAPRTYARAGVIAALDALISRQLSTEYAEADVRLVPQTA